MMTTVLRSTYPAPLKMATLASHMITSSVLLYPAFALGTVLDIFIDSSPVSEAGILCRGTIGFAMPLLATAETDLEPALTHCLPFGSLLNEVSAIRARTPLQIGIQVHINVLFESEVLVKHFFRPKFSNVFSTVFLSAVLVRTLNEYDLAVGYHVVKVVRDAFATESMATATQTMHILCLEVHIADFTHHSLFLWYYLGIRLYLSSMCIDYLYYTSSCWNSSS